MISALFLGFLIGLQHAFEADHVAAVASIAANSRRLRTALRHGAVWGLGHTVTLLLLGGLVVYLGEAIPQTWAEALELLVGVMLVGLGASLLYRLWRERVHFHPHRHDGGVTHLHAHKHARAEVHHDPRHHAHEHPKGLPLRSLAVGMVHGLAGSAALVLLALGSAESVPVALAYIVLFGLGSIVGMAALSAVMAVPLSYTARVFTWANRGLQAAVAVVTMAVGASIVHGIAVTGWGLI
jgi:ABC-type nickel/cobalt efflux system permease component RcnA